MDSASHRRPHGIAQQRIVPTAPAGRESVDDVFDGIERLID
jgi:hypothetical protein